MRRLHTAVFADRPESVQLISFRRANRAEMRAHEAIAAGGK